MITIAIRFAAGRYHATPWGRHVNEGEVEWPPSPWRISRALLAAGFAKLGWSEVPETARNLIERLAAAPPRYLLPDGTVAHTRHYMPVRKGRRETTTKVLDTFIRFDEPDAELLIQYAVELEDAERVLLERLVAGLGYLGRAESWVVARVLVDDPVAGEGAWCRPVEAGELPPPGADVATVVAPVPAERYRAWRADAVERARAAREEERGRPPTRTDSRKIAEAHPEDLVHALLAVTGDLQKQGWNVPPGSQDLDYLRPSGTLRRRPIQPPRRRGTTSPVEAALLALASDRDIRAVLPSMERSLPQLELIHRSLVSQLGDDAPGCPALTGRDPATGRPLAHQHTHATYIPLDLDEDGLLDHVLVHAPMGLDPVARRALRSLRRTWTKGEDRDLVVTLAGLGSIEDFAAQLYRRSGRSLPVLGQGRVWSSVTPFVPPRHMKKRRHTLADQVRDQLQSRGHPSPVSVEPLDRNELVGRHLLKYVRTRRPPKPQPPANRAFGIRIVFDQPVRGPIALGYGSHYGLGVLAAEAGGQGCATDHDRDGSGES